MATFAKPENALKRAEELINVGQKNAALQALHDLITSKRYRAWQKPLEKIMFKYVELCVDLRKGRFAKDGLIQYRIVCQQVNVSSLEEVIKHFMHLSTEKAEQARNQAQALEDALDVEDLEADRRPEDLMLSYVSGEKGKDRSDRELVTPWFKFLWETYRTVLEILRNNSKLESLYAMTAHRAFQFCKQYKRTTEFRRLCDIIRNHLANLNKYRDQRDRPDLTATESLQLYLDTRVEQLKIATDLELWQEAFRSVEDIHGLMCMVKKTPKPSLMVVYYAKMTEIFWVSESYLYHAYAWLKLFSLQKSYNKNLTQKDLQLIASAVLLAAVSVSPFDTLYGASHLELENEKERNLRIASLIGFSLDPKRDNRELLSRPSLLIELANKGILSCVPQEVKDLYHLLEHEFCPLDLAVKAQSLLAKISKLGGKISSASSVPEVQLSQYLPALEGLATLRVLQQVSQVYETMEIEKLSKLIPFFDFSNIEKLAVHAGKYNFIAMRFDHLNDAVNFGSLDLESDTFCNHLTQLVKSLSIARSMIYPPAEDHSKLGDHLAGLPDVVDKEHKRLLARKSIIEKRKEEHERHMIEIEHEEKTKRLQLQKVTEEAELRRLAEESKRREERRIQQEIKERELMQAQALLSEALGGKKKGKRPQIEPEKVTREALLELALSEQLKERQETEKKLQKLSKTMDYMERAKREVEAPLIETAYKQRLVEEEILHEQEKRNENELSRQHHEGDLQEKNRLSRMLENKIVFQNKLVSRREEELSRLKKEQEDKINQLIAIRKRERDTKRKLLFYLQTEEERRNRLREEEEARKREEAERKKKEEAERKAKLDEIAERQRKRELELEEKRERQQREALLRPSIEPQLPKIQEPTAAPAAAAAPVPAAAVPAAAAAAAAPATAASLPGKYVPKFRRGQAEPAAPPPESDRRSKSDDRPLQSGGDRWGKPDDRPPPSGDRWTRSNDDKRPSFGAPRPTYGRR